jgi:hypothetical protein
MSDHVCLASLIDGLDAEVKAALAHKAWEAEGRKGMQVPFHGDFAGTPVSNLKRLEWWVRELRAAAAQQTARPPVTSEATDPETRRLSCCGAKMGWCRCHP